MLFATLTLTELIILGVFGIAFVIASAVDRHGRPEPKWWLVALLLIWAGIWWWKDWTFSGIWATLTTAATWVPVSYYVGVGLAVSIIEFVLHVNFMKNVIKEKWQHFLDSTVKFSYQHENAQLRDVISGHTADQNSSIEVHISHWISMVIDRSETFLDFDIESSRADNGQYSTTINPIINKGRLADYIGAWTTFWPAYVLERVIGDLLLNTWNFIAKLFTGLGRHYVKSMFSNVFKV